MSMVAHGGPWGAARLLVEALPKPNDPNCISDQWLSYVIQSCRGWIEFDHIFMMLHVLFAPTQDSPVPSTTSLGKMTWYCDLVDVGTSVEQ